MTPSAVVLAVVFPRCPDPDAWARALEPALQRYDINTVPRVCSFLAQTGYESSQFTRLVENLNYTSVARLVEVFRKRLPNETVAAPYVRNPEGLANRVYANRLGNGPPASGDGYRYRGRGLIQITGRGNYRAAGEALGLDLVEDPDLLRVPEHAAMSAAWFWKSRGLNELADDETTDDDLEDFTRITRLINNGTTGLRERLAVFDRVEDALGLA